MTLNVLQVGSSVMPLVFQGVSFIMSLVLQPLEFNLKEGALPIQ